MNAIEQDASPDNGFPFRVSTYRILSVRVIDLGNVQSRFLWRWLTPVVGQRLIWLPWQRTRCNDGDKQAETNCQEENV